ncbi:hypothetical protein JQ607_18070 [Bradyrhizobium liaoningense]|uniref:hypothetical protein n=1 Tax=Bradyrhizobium liaoningense TaxID=43992 RepID=UPI001BAB3823|nr:hypothetical protein [Bradyrhizobium liaoningense]MBR0842109.1 hypothetical protein [Bradyrhizobium liaoningense]MBR0858139.1 hypothetical protein [Bradyrhizobium liaoningense]
MDDHRLIRERLCECESSNWGCVGGNSSAGSLRYLKLCIHKLPLPKLYAVEIKSEESKAQIFAFKLLLTEAGVNEIN